MKTAFSDDEIKALNNKEIKYGASPLLFERLDGECACEVVADRQKTLSSSTGCNELRLPVERPSMRPVPVLLTRRTAESSSMVTSGVAEAAGAVVDEAADEVEEDEVGVAVVVDGVVEVEDVADGIEITAETTPTSLPPSLPVRWVAI